MKKLYSKVNYMISNHLTLTFSQTKAQAEQTKWLMPI
jgi:hypothetical protein